MTTSRTFVIGAGGTAGHVVPALAVADALRDAGHRVVFVGGDREEQRLVPEAGYELRRISVEGFSRTNPLKAARAGGRAVGAVRAARRILRELQPDAVMGGGGYVAGVVGAAAVSRRIPLVLTEADSHLGVSNRMLHSRAHRVCLGFPIAGRDEPTFLVTGRPVPPPFADHAGARARFGLDERTPTVLVFGGSLGARSVNEAAVGGLTGLRAPALDGSGETDVAVLHASGRRDFPDLAPRVRAAGGLAIDGDEATTVALEDDRDGVSPKDVRVVAAGRTMDAGGTEVPVIADAIPTDATAENVERAATYALYDYLSPLSPALAACDLVVARSGGSIAEVTAHGRPAVLVPYPHAAADHQTANARWMADGGAAVVITDPDLTAEGLRDAVVGLLGDPTRLRTMAEASAALARPDAARAIADEVLAAAGG
ncbi:glycosyltransferase [Patulibacter sp.]|uniref:UDP-N-acetylglucosamine--N-acetylmuramyl- (pentapeptide) pyrophosphoryl-undecaprenol N-acetylglucosamine transferase n=1 Tax=Patulibacter sp. TaxID=1912859 RepID=UPI002720B4C4|nr:UDP-N-acetylglucosamine--N-acetylmuramyl-(pentapeptide) pyrophosphoryl-undecaprenol N-acetylglucosamine transferase [Patulibacter sp.]MDO9410926.1 UDP-N-acetylglucosamine--N-acetylmuramyl-(pentapeptide) pyrophosphoryl-undecaprenol N-acetylglucosamine transferase [Patulibacter sp.]